MGDFSFRAVEVLQSVDLILAEDTRHSRALLERHGIDTPTASYHEHNEAKTTPKLVERLRAGEDLALITDAGTPLLSDPGQRLVQAAVAADVRVIPVPGASALLAALVASGLPTDRFTFFGFLARKGAERRRTIDEIASSPHTAVLYEAPSRVAESLRELAERGGAATRMAVVARELTKQFEEIRRGTLESLRTYYTEAPPRGEVVIVIAGAPSPVLDETALEDEARAMRSKGLSVRDVAVALTKMGASRNAAYQMARKADKGNGK